MYLCRLQKELQIYQKIDGIFVNFESSSQNRKHTQMHFLIFFLFFIFLHKSATLSPEPACSEGMVCTTAIISKNRWSEEQKVC